MKTSWDVTIWIGDDVNVVHTVTAGVHTITISGDETGRVALQFLDGLDGLVSFRDEISRAVADWVPPTPDDDINVSAALSITDPCMECMDGEAESYRDSFLLCSTCGKSWPF